MPRLHLVLSGADHGRIAGTTRFLRNKRETVNGDDNNSMNLFYSYAKRRKLCIRLIVIKRFPHV